MDHDGGEQPPRPLSSASAGGSRRGTHRSDVGRGEVRQRLGLGLRRGRGRARGLERRGGGALLPDKVLHRRLGARRRRLYDELGRRSRPRAARAASGRAAALVLGVERLGDARGVIGEQSVVAVAVGVAVEALGLLGFERVRARVPVALDAVRDEVVVVEAPLPVEALLGRRTLTRAALRPQQLAARGLARVDEELGRHLHRLGLGVVARRRGQRLAVGVEVRDLRQWDAVHIAMTERRGE